MVPKSPGRFVIGCSGLGIRTVTDFKATVISALANARFFVRSYERGLPIQIKFHVFEQQKEGASGGGFRLGTDATANTPLPDPMQIEGLERIPKQYNSVVRMGIDLAGCVSDYVGCNFEQILAELKIKNPCAAAMLMNSYRNGRLDTSRPCITRGIIAQVELESFQYLRKFARNGLNEAMGFPYDAAPFIDMEIHYSSLVKRISLRNPTKPKFMIETNGSQKSYTVDFASVANGATSKYLELDPGVADRTLLGDATYERTGDFFYKHNLLNKDGLFKQNVSIGFMGTKLHSFDRKALAHAFSPMAKIEKRDDTHRVMLDRRETQKHKGLFKTFSRGKVSVPAPRHGEDGVWPEGDSILSARHVHALFATGSINALSLLLDVAVSIVAMKLKMLPQDILKKQAVADLMQYHHTQTNQYLDPRVTDPTPPRLMRIALHRILYGQGLGSSIEEEEFSLAAPHTRREREGFPIDNSWGLETASPIELGPVDVASYDRAWDLIMQYVTGSPFEVHDTIAQGFIKGVDSQSAGRAEDVVQQPNGKLRLGDSEFDVLMGAPIISREADSVLSSLRGQVRENSAGQAHYAKWRLYQAQDGRLCHAWDYGLGGEGITTFDKYGQPYTKGRQWADTTSARAAALASPMKAKTLLLLGTIAARGHPAAAEHLAECYQNQLPSEAKYSKETNSLSNYWEDFAKKHAFVELCQRISVNGDQFAKHMAFIRTEDSRDSFVEELCRDSTFTNFDAVSAYEEKVSKIPRYAPTSHSEFDSRFIDPLPFQLDAIWGQVLAETEASYPPPSHEHAKDSVGSICSEQVDMYPWWGPDHAEAGKVARIGS